LLERPCEFGAGLERDLGEDPVEVRANRAIRHQERSPISPISLTRQRVAGIPRGVLSPEEQQRMSEYVPRLLTSIDRGEWT
jgi:hypothetical protein